jgi:hypothetical protein
MGGSLLALVTTGAIGPEVYALGAAALVVAIGGLAIAALLLGRRGSLPAAAVDFPIWTGIVAAGLSFGAAAIHFAVISEHFAEYPPYGVAFTLFAWFQVGWAVLYLRRQGRRLAALAILVNLGGIVVWAVSRVVGLPVGPEPGAIEPIGPLDVLAAGLEIALIGILLWNLAAQSARARPSLSPSSSVVYLGSALLTVVLLTTVAFASTGGSSHAGASEGHAHSSVESPPSADASSAPGADASATPSASAAAAGSPAASPSVVVERPGTIAFGSGVDLAGQLQGSGAVFRPGQAAVWLADLSEPPGVPTVRFIIVQILPDGREFEHWRQDMTVADPGGRQLIGMADLSIYAHGGTGNYRMRYFRGDQLLAEGAFELAE